MTVNSPCIERCELDHEGKYCLGCFRSVDEISGWKNFSNNKKLDILNKIKLRKNEQNTFLTFFYFNFKLCIR